jgi:hypothetical protein
MLLVLTTAPCPAGTEPFVFTQLASVAGDVTVLAPGLLNGPSRELEIPDVGTAPFRLCEIK